MADDDDRRRSWRTVLVGAEGASQRGRHAEDGEEIPRDVAAARTLGLMAVDAELDAVGASRRENALKDRCPIPKGLVQRVRDEIEARTALGERRDPRRIADGDERCRIAHVERPEEHGVDEGEDRGVGADA